MKTTRWLLLGLLSLPLVGCAAFRSPSPDQARRNEDRARAAEYNRTADEREKIIDSRNASDRSRS